MGELNWGGMYRYRRKGGKRERWRGGRYTKGGREGEREMAFTGGVK